MDVRNRSAIKKCIENKGLEEGKEKDGKKGALSFLGGRLSHVACRIRSFLIIHSSTEHDIDNRRVILTSWVKAKL